MAETKGQQVKHVVERVALGALAVGVEAMSSTKMALELRFDHVWRLWSPASRFPSLGRGPHAPGNLFWIGLLDSAGRRWASAAWGKDGRCPAVPANGWLLEELDDCLAHFGRSWTNGSRVAPAWRFGPVTARTALPSLS